MKQREYPLFIIDTSRQHKRERDTDYLQCTAVDCPFIAEICFINEDEFRAVYKREDKLSIYSHSNCGIRIRIHIVQFLTTTNEQRTTSLLKKALKCVLERRKIKEIDHNNIKKGDIVTLMELLIEQTEETLAKNPGERQPEILNSIFKKIKKDYSN